MIVTPIHCVPPRQGKRSKGWRLLIYLDSLNWNNPLQTFLQVQTKKVKAIGYKCVSFWDFTDDQVNDSASIPSFILPFFWLAWQESTSLIALPAATVNLLFRNWYINCNFSSLAFCDRLTEGIGSVINITFLFFGEWIYHDHCHSHFHLSLNEYFQVS